MVTYLHPLRYVHTVESPQQSADVNPRGFALSIHVYLSCTDEFAFVVDPKGTEMLQHSVRGVHEVTSAHVSRFPQAKMLSLTIYHSHVLLGDVCILLMHSVAKTTPSPKENRCSPSSSLAVLFEESL